LFRVNTCRPNFCENAFVAEASLAPFRLAPWFSPRPWGSRSLLPWYDKVVPDGDEPIGEAWLTGPDCVVETGPHHGLTLAQVAQQYPAELLGPFAAEKDYPLLMKILFPHDKLSVQVHPDDALAQQGGHARGKTECWYFLDAEKGAKIDLGLKDGVTHEAIRKAIADGTLEELVEQVPVRTGDMVFVDAGTVHAIGAGVTILETQQQCDLTYRLYDYGRPRELHVEPGLAATRLTTQAGKVRPRQLESHGGLHSRLIEQRYFTVDRYDVRAGETMALPPSAVPRTLVSLAGDVSLQPADHRLKPIALLAAQAVVVPPSRKPSLMARENAVVLCAIPGKA
jgi:mannose-6-phosphate isomerase